MEININFSPIWSEDTVNRENTAGFWKLDLPNSTKREVRGSRYLTINRSHLDKARGEERNESLAATVWRLELTKLPWAFYSPEREMLGSLAIQERDRVDLISIKNQRHWGRKKWNMILIFFFHKFVLWWCKDFNLWF